MIPLAVGIVAAEHLALAVAMLWAARAGVLSLRRPPRPRPPKEPQP
ncbi:MAG TPA: hypothetical protein VH641_14460 [Streptosporangiaceae bacterium]|jgi:hypothetical protein